MPVPNQSGGAIYRKESYSCWSAEVNPALLTTSLLQRCSQSWGCAVLLPCCHHTPRPQGAERSSRVLPQRCASPLLCSPFSSEVTVLQPAIYFVRMANFSTAGPSLSVSHGVEKAVHTNGFRIGIQNKEPLNDL